MDPARLVQLLVWHASRQGTKLSSIRLVKLLYLADLYTARVRGGKTLTGWPWRFHHYGPFCVESLRAIEAAEGSSLIDFEQFESKFRDEPAKVFFFHREEEDQFDQDAAERDLPSQVVSALRAAVKKWGDDTHAMLDHVYFETEPMLEARPGDLLDFTKARPFKKLPPPQVRPATKEQLKRGQELIARLAAKATAKRDEGFVTPTKFFDEAYAETLRRLGEEDSAAPEFQGSANIEP